MNELLLDQGTFVLTSLQIIHLCCHGVDYMCNSSTTEKYWNSLLATPWMTWKVMLGSLRRPNAKRLVPVQIAFAFSCNRMQAAACDQCMQDPCTCASADGSNGEQRKRARVTEIESKDGDTVEETEDTATVMEERIPLPEWCHTAQWTLLPRTPEQIAWCSSEDAAEDSDGKFVVLPEAANVNPRRRAIVTLPSGAVMACMVSVLVKYCPTLRDKASDLLTNVIQLRYQPERSWSDEDVLGFFSLLHKFNTDQDAIQNSIVDPAWSALATALGIKEYVEFCQQTIQKKLEAGPPKVRDVARLARSTPPRSIQEITWKWIAAYRQFTDEETWRQSCLSYFLPMKFSLFRQYWAAEQRPRIAEMFSGSDLFALAYSRWNCWRQGTCDLSSCYRTIVRDIMTRSTCSIMSRRLALESQQAGGQENKLRRSQLGRSVSVSSPWIAGHLMLLKSRHLI